MTDTPHLNAYIARVHARQRNFARWVVEHKDEDAYRGWHTLATIKLSGDGTISCSSPLFAPTDEEVEAIKLELRNVQRPKSIPTKLAQLARLKSDQLRGVNDKDIFVYKTTGDDCVLFVQQRTYKADGVTKEADLPWSFFDDGNWYNMEPSDDMLPIYGQDRMANANRFMIHEGAAAAKKVQALVDEGGARLAAHPWADALRNHAHLGWPGGTDRVDVVDWSPIKKLGGHKYVVLVADNDQKGIEAVAKVSRILSRTLDVVIFDSRFPDTFDLADPWPNHPEFYLERHTDRRYIGPTFDELCQSATWATQIRKLPGSEKPVITVRNQFAAEWVYIKMLNVFVNRRRPHRMLTKDVFNQHVHRFSDADDTARLLSKHVIAHCDTAIYRPGSIQGIINVDGERAINIHRPPRIRPPENPDPALFLEFMEHLIPDPGDRKHVMRWCATLIAKPHVRMRYALLLMSEIQGVGKSTLGEILAKLVGLWNASFPSENDIVDSDFNGWLAHKRLAVVQEIYSGHSWKAYNKLKSKIADRWVDVNKKYVPQYTDENWCNILACSNSMRPLRMEDEDRRWLIPRVTEELKELAYWQRLHYWLEFDGLGAIEQWAKEYGHYVSEGDHAPSTTAKERLILESRTPVLKAAYEIGCKAKETTNEKILLLVDEVLEYAKGCFPHERNTDTSLDVRKVLLASGLFLAQQDGEIARLHYAKGRRSYAVVNFDIESELVGKMTWDNVKRWHKLPADMDPRPY